MGTVAIGVSVLLVVAVPVAVGVFMVMMVAMMISRRTLLLEIAGGRVIAVASDVIAITVLMLQESRGAKARRDEQPDRTES